SSPAGGAAGPSVGAAVPVPGTRISRSGLSRERANSPPAMSTTVARAAHAKPIHPRPRWRGARCAPTLSRSSGTSSKRSLMRVAMVFLGLFVAAARASGAAPSVAQPAQSSHEHGIACEGRWGFDHGVQQLIVTGRGEPKLHADRLLLGAGVRPATTLE